ncbi:coiled-coil domain-containing protein 50 isoform X2 [Trichomycterus rosablanca]|uniref:coiled-coil domain-containing protein 50 isoform X2 n=1 Tax=Trichomycterus rosablanca TaxID=2290929 RepID=UPI002F35C7B6
MEDISIDRNRLPGVREVCRDFAVLEDHCLAHNLQEQEIENHLASNVHKNRLVQQDLRVAKRLQEEEELRAKTESQKEHQDIERIDNEIAQEIQDQLVRQAEQQRKQEEKDEAIARKIQEREMKEEWKRQKQLEAKLEEQYYEERGGRHVQEKYGMREATEGIAQMDLRAQEIRDIEVARRIQQEEVKASKLDKRAAQVAQDEEIARRLMEEEEREFKRSREKEKQALERQHRRADGDFKAVHDEAIRPRTREQYDHQRARDSKPSRPPPHSNNYENVDSSYAYSDNYSPRPPPRPEAAYKGAYYRQ